MDRPDYALKTFRLHFDTASFARKSDNFVALEIGPGDSLCSALIGRAFGASRIFLVDVEACASTDIAVYQRMEAHLRQLGLYLPHLDHCRSVAEVAKACSAEYMTDGLASLRQIPSASVDFVWSNAVLPCVRRNEFVPVLQELRRIQRPDGVGSHRIPIQDIIGGNLNDLRFSSRVWESSIMANSGFYTNRLRYLELLQLFRVVGFEPEVVRKKRWQTLPTPRRKMSEEFARLTEEDLHVCEFDVLLR
jgi:SAM-dependent methyltransferase